MHKKIMVQGTSSSVGKTTIVAGLCRVFFQDGHKVSPFKSQNMSLNSYVFENGLEMSKANAIQAECANQEPQVFMNPIMLKPKGDDYSEVFIEGVYKENMKAKRYFESSDKFKEIALKNYNIIKENFDIGVLEGGGSPAEMNLRKYDFVNMGMAEMVDAPVILVGNIEIGGVFAAIYGTVMILEEKDRKRIKGFVINKFRGDLSLLIPGIEHLVEKFKDEGLDIKYLGTIPYQNIDIEDEDSIDEKKLLVENFDNKVENDKPKEKSLKEKNKEYDKLSDLIRESLNMDLIYDILR